MKKYRMVMSPLARDKMRRHRQSLHAFNQQYAKKMDQELLNTVREIRWNPFLFPIDETLTIPQKQYRKALFGKWYKVLFTVTGNTIQVDTVADCRMNPETIRRELE